MKKLIALISAIAVMGTMSLTSLAAIEATPNAEVAGAALAKNDATGGYDASYKSNEVNTQTTILAVKGTEINTNSIQYINQLTQDSETAINFDLKDTLAEGDVVNVYMGGDAIKKTLVGKIEYAADPVTKYTVKFVSDGATVSETAYDEGTAIVVPADPTKAADAEYTYAFEGWYAENDETQTVVDLTDAKATANVTYVAKFKATAIPVEPEEPEFMRGDIWVDEEINDDDITALDLYYADLHAEYDEYFGEGNRFWEDETSAGYLAADVYEDGEINDDDITALDLYYADLHTEYDEYFGEGNRFWE